ncbi:hypothetical protein Btru_001647, partial [Bulinus truncatus]
MPYERKVNLLSGQTTVQSCPFLTGQKVMCDAVRVVGLLGSYSGIPVVTWAPVQRSVVGDGVVSTYGSYEDFTRAAFVVMRHLKWMKTAKGETPNSVNNDCVHWGMTWVLFCVTRHGNEKEFILKPLPKHYTSGAVSIFYERDGNCDYLIEEMRNRFLLDNEFVEALVVRLKAVNSSTLADGLIRARVLTRTMIVCTGRDTMQTILQMAETMKMTSGYYAFLYLSFDFTPFEFQLMEKVGDARLNQALLGCVLQLGQFPQVTDLRKGRPVMTEKHVTSETQPPMSRSQYFHDAVAVAVVLAHRGTRGVNTVGYNITAPHLQTGAIVIDEQGVRRSAFHLVHYQSGGRQVIVAKVTPDLDLITPEPIVWPGGRVSESDLMCDAGCSGGQSDTYFTGVVAGCVVGALFLLAVMATAVFFYRKYRRRSVEESKDWIVEDKDVKRRKFKANGLSGGANNSNNYTNGVTTSCNGSVKKRLVRMVGRRVTKGNIAPGNNYLWKAGVNDMLQ